MFRKVWRTEDKRPSISSEESLSDYEEVGGNLPSRGLVDGSRAEAGAQIWDSREIQAGLRLGLVHGFVDGVLVTFTLLFQSNIRCM